MEENKVIRMIKNKKILNQMFGKKEIHVEMCYIPETKQKLLNHLNKYHSKCFVLTPANYEYVRSHSGLKLTKEEYSKVLKEFYSDLKRMGIDLQLHIHLSMFPENMNAEEKKKLIKEGYDFFKELGIAPTQVTFGWYKSDKVSEDFAESLNLKIVGHNFHVYDFWL